MSSKYLFNQVIAVFPDARQPMVVTSDDILSRIDRFVRDNLLIQETQRSRDEKLKADALAAEARQDRSKTRRAGDQGSDNHELYENLHELLSNNDGDTRTLAGKIMEIFGCSVVDNHLQKIALGSKNTTMSALNDDFKTYLKDLNTYQGNKNILNYTPRETEFF